MKYLRVSVLFVLLLPTVLKAEYTRNGFWEYISQLTNAKESADQVEQLKVSRESKSLKESLQDGVNYMGHLLSPLNARFQERLYQDSDGLRRLIRSELEDLRRKLSPYVDEVHQKITRNVEQVRQRLLPFTDELLDQVGIQAMDLKKQLAPNHQDIRKKLQKSLGEIRQFVSEYAEEFQDKISLHTGQVKQVFHPYADKIVTEIHQTMEELHRNVAPHAQASQEQLKQHVQELSQKLTKNAKELHEKIHKNLDNLKAKLILYPSELKDKFGTEAVEPQVGDVPPYMKELSNQVEQEIEEFRKSTFLQIEDFTKTINRETEEMKSKLSVPSMYTEELQDSLNPVEDMQQKLDSLWEDLSLSLS
ncbi:apolipoprotein A-V isoform X1 [Lissotriton helveticus]